MLLEAYSVQCEKIFKSHWGRRTVPEHSLLAESAVSNQTSACMEAAATAALPSGNRGCTCKCAQVPNTYMDPSSFSSPSSLAGASSDQPGASRCLTIRQSDLHPSLIGVFIDHRCHSNSKPSLSADDFICHYAQGQSGFIFTLSEFDSMPFAAHTAFQLPISAGKDKSPDDIYLVVSDPTSIPANINHQRKQIASCKFSSCANKVSENRDKYTKASLRYT